VYHLIICHVIEACCIGYFQQGNATAQAADKRLHGCYIQDDFKQNK
jgi:hypothetical protein